MVWGHTKAGSIACFRGKAEVVGNAIPQCNGFVSVSLLKLTKSWFDVGVVRWEKFLELLLEFFAVLPIAAATLVSSFGAMFSG